MSRAVALAFVILVALASAEYEETIEDIEAADMCTTMIFGRKATVDGSVMTTHTADCKECDHRFFYVPAQDHEEGAQRPIYLGAEFKYMMYPRYRGFARGPGYYPKTGENVTEPIGFIPQVRHTYGYFDTVYGVMNEHQVGIGESTCAAKISALPRSQGGQALFDMQELSRLAMERSKTAREALDLITSMAEQYGFYGGWLEGHVKATAGEALTIIDPQEAWILHMLASPNGTSAVWAAVRVPDDEISVVSNTFMITELDLSKPHKFRASANVMSVAQEQGFWKPEDGAFDFAKAYAWKTARNTTQISLYSTLRTWRVFDVFAPHLKLKPGSGDIHDYPFSVKPKDLVSVDQVMNMNRDYFQDTDYDLSKGMSAGPFGSPIRWEGGPNEKNLTGQWARAISIHRTSYSTVLQARGWLPDAIGGLVWLGQDAPHTTVYVPMYAGITDTPVSYRTGSLQKFTRESAWWAFDFLSNFAELKYNFMSKDIREKQKLIEGQTLAKLEDVEKKALQLYRKDVGEAKGYLTNFCLNHAEEVVKQWWEFVDFMIMKYNDGYINTPRVGACTGYPEWWLRLVKFDGDARYKLPDFANKLPMAATATVKSAPQARHAVGFFGLAALSTLVAVLFAGLGFAMGKRNRVRKNFAFAELSNMHTPIVADAEQVN